MFCDSILLLKEAQRMHNILPNNLFHSNLEATRVGSHFIPKRTCIQPQIATVLFNEQVGVLDVDERCTCNDFISDFPRPASIQT